MSNIHYFLEVLCSDQNYDLEEHNEPMLDPEDFNENEDNNEMLYKD